MPPSARSRSFRVGALVLAALAVLAAGIFLIGDQNNLFRLKNEYSVRFANVSGLNHGNPVQLNGVDVGTVARIVLPTDPGDSLIEVVVSIDRRYAGRVRADSMARIKTLGLLGAKYVEITSGSPGSPEVPSGAEIKTAPPTDVDALLASGEDLVDNVVAVSASLRTILARMERGEGLLGQLISDEKTGPQIRDSVVSSLESLERLTKRFEKGQGALPRLIEDKALGDHLATSVEHLERVLDRTENGPGLLPALLNDDKMRDQAAATLATLQSASRDLAAFAHELRDGQGLLPRLVNDETYGAEVSQRLHDLTDRLDKVSRQLTEGEGTLAQLINDPQLYEQLQEILVGVDESRLLRWLIRNRQKAGIEKRYQEEHARTPASPEAPPAEPPKSTPPPSGR